MNRFNPQYKLLKHYTHLYKFLNQEHIYPILVEISPTNICNAKCSFCFYVGKHTKEEIEFVSLKNTLKEFKECGIKAINWTGGGEPTIYSKFREATEYANELNLEQGLFTNAYNPTQVNPSLFKWTRISITPRYFFFAQTLTEWSDYTTVGVCMSVTPETIGAVKLMCQLSSRYGADYFQIRPALASPNKQQSNLKFKDFEHLKEYESENFKVELSPYKFETYIQPRSYTKCYGCYFCPSLIYNGDITTCNYHFEEESFTLGNIYQDNFKTIWNSARTKEILDSLENDKLKNCQICCKNDQINKLLFELKNGNLENINFL